MEIGEGAALPDIEPLQHAETCECDWSNCKKQHPAPLRYKGGGNVTRGGNLRQALAGQEPWNGGGYGAATKPIYFKNGNVKKAANGSPFKEYQIEAHHLIPIKQMKNMTSLKSNAVLVGWDIDHMVNGMFLPADEMDIAIHHLQQHEGSHCGGYTQPITEALRAIEKDFVHACDEQTDTELQEQLKLELGELSARATNKILAMRKPGGAGAWPLHRTSAQKFRDVLLEYARRKALRADEER